MIKLICVLAFASATLAQDAVSKAVAPDASLIRPLPIDISPCPGKGEVYIKYGPQCPQTCKWLNKQCTLQVASKPGCYCPPDYVRDANGNCVLGNAFCGNCTTHEYYANPGPNCDVECATLGQPCTRVYIQAPFGCYCLPGYARDANNTCIAIEKCKSKSPIIP